MCCRSMYLNTCCGSWPGSNGIPGQYVIEVMLHVKNVVFYHKMQGFHAPSDDAPVLHVPFGNTCDKVCEKGVVGVPEIHQRTPRHVPVSVSFHPLLLSVAKAAEFAVDGCQREADMVVCGGIDQVAEFLLASPAVRASVRV